MQLVSSAAVRGRSSLRTAETWLTAVRPVWLLVPLAALQVAQAFWFAFNTPHNGWIWYSGGDATSYWTEAWAVGHRLMPAGAIGWANPLAYSWVSLVAGPSLLQGAKVIAVLQAVVLVPLTLLLFWLVANRLFGRVYAWAAVALWVAGPLLLLHGFVPDYHWVFDQLFLVPHWFGFTDMADLPSVAGVLATFWLTLRAVDDGSPTDGVLAGIAAGVTIGLKPSTGFIVPAAAVLVIGMRRWREGALWIAGVVPGVVALALWKSRGLGTLPIKSATGPDVHTAAGLHPVIATGVTRYLPLDWHHFNQELNSLREVFWSLRFIEFLAVAGAFGVIRKSPVRGLFVVVWFATFGIVKASTSGSDFPSATYFRLAEPALPAYILLAVGVAYCVPAWGRRVALAHVPSRGFGTIAWRRVGPAALIFGLLPILVIATLRSSGPYRYARDENRVQEAPFSSAFHLQAVRIPGNKVRLSWQRPPSGGAQTTFLVMTSGDDNGCAPLLRGANHCKLNDMTTLIETGNTTYTDSMEEYVHKWYRVALAASYNQFHGDLMLVSTPVEVSR